MPDKGVFWNNVFEKEDRRYLLPTKLVLKSMLDYPQIKTVADIGGGNGEFALSLAGAGYNVDMYDRSEQAMSRARQRLDKAEVGVFALDLDKDSVPRSYDAITMNSVLAFVADKDGCVAMVREHTKHVFFLWSVFIDKEVADMDSHEVIIGLNTNETMEILQRHFTDVVVQHEAKRSEYSSVKLLKCIV